MLRKLNRNHLHALVGGLLLAGLACDGVLTGLIRTDPYSFNEDIEAVLAKMPAAEPDHAAPYTGALAVESGVDIGTMLMSSCGCGFWRVYAEFGGERYLAQIDFPEFPDSFSTFVPALDEPLALTGRFIEDGEIAFGELIHADTVTRFRAERLENAATTGCLLCHLGDDPPRPLPDTHTAVTQATDCLACHETTGH